MINVASFPLVRQNTRDNCIPATIESIVKYHKPQCQPTWSDQTYIRRLMDQQSLLPSFPNSCAVLKGVQTDVKIDVEDFQALPSSAWVDRVDDLVNNFDQPVAFAGVLVNPSRIHIRAILAYDGSTFTVFDPGPGSVFTIPKQHIIDDIERVVKVSATQSVGPCRDILIIEAI